MKKFFAVFYAFFLLTQFVAAQTVLSNSVKPTPALERSQAFRQHQKLISRSLIKNIPFRSIGPTVMSGRVVDIEGDPQDGRRFYVAYASGGLWFSANNGLSFKPLFQEQAVITIGDVAVDWQHGGTVWLGSGENNSSRSSYAGNGIYKSTDQGKTWQYLGLGETQHIGRIVINPTDPNTVWVAALGHLYSPNVQRGIYKTTDGGKTWRQTLFINENTGAIDLVLDPQNPQILYAATWQRSRRAWNFEEGGAGSGIYKSIDGGERWQLLSTKESGFPTGKGVGRIGLTISPTHPQILYAVLDNQFHRPKEKETPALTKAMLRTMSAEKFLHLKPKDINDFLDRNDFPIQFNADTLFQLIKAKTITPKTLLDYLENANNQLFETPVIGAQVYQSEDRGQTWHKTHIDYLDKVVYTFGYYFGQIRVSPFDTRQIYLLGVPALQSSDGGQTFKTITRENVHVDHHALWIDPHRKGHLIMGNDGGVNISYDNGKTWFKANTPGVSQFYSVAVDMAEPFHVYGGMQDNGVWVGPASHHENRSWRAGGRYAYKELLGGDGMQIAVDTRDNITVYTGYQFGNYFRINRKTGKQKNITPKHHLGQRPLRFNWQTPIWLSKHNQDILYLGSQKLHRSLDKGEHWQAISGDLTKGGRKGDVPYGTLTAIHESPLQFGLIYTGSDDGLVYVTRDGGHVWQRISDSLPQNYWISRVWASAFDTATVYVALNGYRWDNFNALLYKSDNYGKNWRRIGRNLPDAPINVVKEDPHNPALIYVGTDHGLYASLDSGKTFMAFVNGLPDAPVHDVAVQARDREMIVATHGRSLFTAHIEPLEKLNLKLRRKALYIFPVKTLTYNKDWGRHTYSWNFVQSPQVSIVFYCRQAGKSKIRIYGSKHFLLTEAQDTCTAGLNYFIFDCSIAEKPYKKYFNNKKKLKAADNGKFYLKPGRYIIEVQQDNKKQQHVFEIKEKKKKLRAKKKTP